MESNVDLLKQKLKVIKHGLAVEERQLTLQNYVEFIMPSDECENVIYIPVNTLTPSELQGMSLLDERLLRQYGCTIITKAGIMLRLP